MPFCGEIGELAEIGRTEAEELSVGWRIRNVFSLSGGRNNFYTSPVFAIGDERWDLRIWPSWKRETRHPASGWLRLDVCRVDRGSPKTFCIGIGMVGSGGVVKSREVEDVFSGLADYSCEDFCSRSELIEHKTRLMPDGFLTIMCALKKPGTAGGVEKIVEGLDKLLIAGDDSVTVQVGDVEFRVQKAVLSVRSPVLSAMFRRETEEWASSRISIHDCEPEVFKQYLQYIHTGSVGVLSDQSAFSLYQVAAKYSADGLKQQCLQHIRSTLSVQTFCDAVRLALMHWESDLLQVAIDFASRNLSLILRSVEWQNFNHEYPSLAKEILFENVYTKVCPSFQFSKPL